MTANRIAKLKIAAVAVWIAATMCWLVPMVMPSGKQRLATLELAGLVMLPMFVFYLRSNWPARSWGWLVPVLFVLWYATYGALHELSHLMGAAMFHRHIIAFHMPAIWRMETSAWVQTTFTNDWQNTVMGLCPYLRDLLFAIGGFLILRRKRIRSAFLVGLIFILCCLSPVFDIVDNYLNGYIMLRGSGNDWMGTEIHIGAWWTHTLGIALIAIVLGIALQVMRMYKAFPAKPPA